MPIRTDAQKENLAAAYGAAAVSATLYTADPGTTGANEVPGITRQALTWDGGGDDGVVTASATFDVASGTTVTHAGVVDAGGVFLDAVAVTEQTFSTDGQLTVNFTYTQG